MSSHVLSCPTLAASLLKGSRQNAFGAVRVHTSGVVHPSMLRILTGDVEEKGRKRLRAHIRCSMRGWHIHLSWCWRFYGNQLISDPKLLSSAHHEHFFLSLSPQQDRLCFTKISHYSQELKYCWARSVIFNRSPLWRSQRFIDHKPRSNKHWYGIFIFFFFVTYPASSNF